MFSSFLLRENGNAANRDSLGATTSDIKALKNDWIKKVDGVTEPSQQQFLNN